MLTAKCNTKIMKKYRNQWLSFIMNYLLWTANENRRFRYCYTEGNHHQEVAQIAKKYSIFVMLHFQASVREAVRMSTSPWNTHVIRRPSRTAEIQHQAIFSEAGPEGSLFLPPASTNSRTSLKFSTQCHSCTKHQQD